MPDVTSAVSPQKSGYAALSALDAETVDGSDEGDQAGKAVSGSTVFALIPIVSCQEVCNAAAAACGFVLSPADLCKVNAYPGTGV